MPYLLKTEPTVYSFASLQRENTTIWDGVTNPAAVKNLRGMKPGEQLVIYHTGDNAGFKATSVWLPDNDLAIASMSNEESTDLEGVISGILPKLL